MPYFEEYDDRYSYGDEEEEDPEEEPEDGYRSSSESDSSGSRSDAEHASPEGTPAERFVQYDPRGIHSPAPAAVPVAPRPPVHPYPARTVSDYDDDSERDRAYRSSSESAPASISLSAATVTAPSVLAAVPRPYAAASVERTLDITGSSSSGAPASYISSSTAGPSTRATSLLGAGTPSRVIDMATYNPTMAPETVALSRPASLLTAVSSLGGAQRKAKRPVPGSSRAGPAPTSYGGTRLSEELRVVVKELVPPPSRGALLVFTLGPLKQTATPAAGGEARFPLHASRDRILDVTLQEDGTSGSAALEVPRSCDELELWLTLSAAGRESCRARLLLTTSAGGSAGLARKQSSVSSSRSSTSSSSAPAPRRVSPTGPVRRAASKHSSPSEGASRPPLSSRSATAGKHIGPQRFWLCLLAREGKFLLDPEHDRGGATQLCGTCAHAVSAAWPGSFQSSQRKLERNKLDSTFQQELNSIRSLYNSTLSEKELIKTRDVEIFHLREQVRALEASNEELMGQLLLARQTADERQRQSEATQREVEFMRASVADAERRKRDMETLLESSERDVKQLRRELLEYRAWRSKTEQAIGRLQREAEERSQETQRQHDANARLKQDMQREKLSLSQLQREIFDSAEERNHSERKAQGDGYVYIAGDRRLVDRQLQEITELKMKNAELVTELNQLKGQQAIVQEERRRLVGEVENLERTLRRHSGGRQGTARSPHATSPRGNSSLLLSPA